MVLSRSRHGAFLSTHANSSIRTPPSFGSSHSEHSHNVVTWPSLLSSKMKKPSFFIKHTWIACNPVEDAPTSPTRDVLNGSSQNRGIGKASGDEEDKQNAKLVGANAAYARGLTPWYAGNTLI
ncbi:uncharacterized protein UDID_18270 [Ustilago sp. UG-2017a]|nr:uncharacterized protein UDID_18270 [Ustilago sp. UG-2017a]